MILIHLLTGLVFGVASVILSIHAGHGFFVGLLWYSVMGAGGMLLSIALSLIPIGRVVQLVVATIRPNLPGKSLTSRSGDLRVALDRSSFGQEFGRAQEL